MSSVPGPPRRFGGRGAPKLERDEDRWTRQRGPTDDERSQLEHPVRSTGVLTAVWATVLLVANLAFGRPAGESLLATAVAALVFAAVWHLVVSDRKARRYRRWRDRFEQQS